MWVSSSAKDQLTGQSVAIKKVVKPFSNPVLSKRTYRELKLLKHLEHENVGIYACIAISTVLISTDYLAQRYLHFPPRKYVRSLSIFTAGLINWYYSYFVTELLGTDLQRLLASRTLEKQFVQYFLYQILVGVSDAMCYLKS